MREPTVFDKIISGELPSTKTYETDRVLAIKDIKPLAPMHLLFIAKNEADYAPSIAELSEKNEHVPALLLKAARDFAAQEGIESYKLSFHCGKDAAEVLDFLHLHFMSEQKLS